MQHDEVGSGRARQKHYRTRSERPIRVQVGQVDTASSSLDPALGNAVARYLIDQGTAALGQHDLFEVVDTRAKSDSLLDQFMEGDVAPSTVPVDGILDLRVREVAEKNGPTIRVGLVSKQSKKAVVQIEATLRLNGVAFTAASEGTATKGAVGVVAAVRRDAMRKTGGVWDLDGSMIGFAGSKALESCVSEIAGKLHRRMRRLDRDAVERYLHPATTPSPHQKK